MRSNSFAVESVYRTNETVVTIDISERLEKTGEMSKHVAQFSGCTFNNCSFSVPVPQPKHEEIVEDDFSSIDINEFLQF